MREPIAVGIIANPASGKDIRRLVAHGSTFDNNEKVNIVRRLLLALDALGVEHVWYMPDTYGIVPRSADPISLALDLRELPMGVFGNSSDSLEAAKRLTDLGVRCIVTLGGDGTNRIVAKGCGGTPLVPISTGTNNVFPEMVEGTVAGLAAGLVAVRGPDSIVSTRLCLDIAVEDGPREIALVDAVLSNQAWIGSRAFWDASQLLEIVLARVSPAAIGICGLGGILFPDNAGQRAGVHISLGDRGEHYLTPLGPGLLAPVQVKSAIILAPGDSVTLTAGDGTLALDGEREIELRAGQAISVRLNDDGPRVVDIAAALCAGAKEGRFRLSHGIASGA